MFFALYKFTGIYIDCLIKRYMRYEKTPINQEAKDCG